MAMTMNDLTVNFRHLDSATLLEDWHWLIGLSKTPILLTASGNAFVQDENDDSVHFLDTDAAQLSLVAENPEALRDLLADREFAANYLAVQMIGALLQSGMRLGPGQIYSFKILPGLGGQYALENIEVSDIAVHFSITGQIHQKVKDLPEGAKIDGFSIS